MEVALVERFFFDLTDGHSTIHDEDGVLAANLDKAVAQAGAVLEEMSAADELSDSDQAWAMIIRDGAGSTLMMLPVVKRVPKAVLAS